MTDRRLVITADDFGLHSAVNAAVEAAYRRGVLTAASLMMGAPATAEAVTLARATPGLRVGLHIVLTEGRPILPPERVGLLVDSDGVFLRNMATAGATIFASLQARRQLSAEIEAQFAAFATTGLKLDHVNAHKHFHVHPTIAACIARIGARHAAPSVRTPVEPHRVLKAVEPGAASWSERLATAFGRAARRRFRRAGFTCPDQVFGIRWSGHMNTGRLAGLVQVLPPGLSEIYLHPATDDAFEGSARGYDYRDELAALTSAEVRQALEGTDIRTGGFLDFA